MAQEPSGSGGQQPSEYDYGQQQWHPGQASATDSGPAGGYEPYDSDRDVWGNPVPQQREQSYEPDQYGGQQYAEPPYGQEQYQPEQYTQQPYDQGQYGGQYGQQQYGQDQYGQAAQPYYGDYGTQGYDPAAYGGQGYDPAAGYGQEAASPYGTRTASYAGDVQGYQEYAPTQPYDAYQQQPAADTAATQQWQAPDFGAPAPPAEPPAAAPQPAPAASPAAAPPAGFAARARAALTGGGHGPDRHTLLVRAAVGGGALVVLAGLGAYATGGGGAGTDTQQSTTAPVPAQFAVDHTKAWSAAPAAAGADDALVGSWLLAGGVVRADGTGVHAYATATGKELWTLQPPQSGAVPCGMSPTVGGSGIGAVLFAPKAAGKSCTLLSAVDTATGKQKWTKTLSTAKGAYSARVMVNDSRVVAVGDSRAVGYDAASGKQQWENKGRGKFCTLSGTGSGSTVLLHSSCADSSPKEQAVALDAAGGRLKWWRGLGTPKTVSVLSAEPAVLLTTGATEADDTIRSWNDKGDPGPVIPVAQDGGRLDVGHGALDPAPSVFFSSTALATAVVRGGGSTAANGSVIAIDLTTGKPLWKVTAREKGKVQPVGIDGDALVVATEERTDQPAHLSRFALADGVESAGGGFPKDTGSVLTSGRVLTSDALVVAVPSFTSAYGTAATAFRAGH
ncbi:PQQ-binding-like beta-propeller repeat protein [Streptomyces sp. NPDC092296]|uniref:outer membrane protein assembly factor BamB family protein n=1 Tax=Streptomyces sp. NPDC092296 TaxID=3366012 RepID=UPI003820B610